MTNEGNGLEEATVGEEASFSTTFREIEDGKIVDAGGK
tara:strand:- start:188 stop:301 length:114 start_codon:yes stop_codon:yes gene_type:complete